MLQYKCTGVQDYSMFLLYARRGHIPLEGRRIVCLRWRFDGVYTKPGSQINDHGPPVVCLIFGSLASLGDPRAVPNGRGSPLGTKHSVYTW